MKQRLKPGRARPALVLMTTLGLALLLTMQGASATSGTRWNSTFEQSLNPWKVGADPSLGTYDLSRTGGDNACPKDGSWYANLRIDTVADPLGGLWIVAPIAVQSGQAVMVDWMSKDVSDTPAVRRPHAAIAYVGAHPPAAHSEFTPVGDIQDAWTAYRHTAIVPPVGTANQPIYVAVGFGPPLENRVLWNGIMAQGGMKIADGPALGPGGLLSGRLHGLATHPGFEQVGIDCVTVTVIASAGEGR